MLAEGGKDVKKTAMFLMITSITSGLFALNLLATINPYYLILKDLAVGTNSEIHLLIKPNTNPHVFSPSFSDIKKLSTADLVFANGLDLEPYLGDYQNVVYVSEFVPSNLLLENALQHEDNHENEKLNPHIWISPKLVKDFVIPGMLEVLSQKDPQNREVYRKNASELLRALEEIHLQFDQLLRNFENGVLVITHPSTVYLTDLYGIKTLALEEGHGKEPSAKKVKEIVNKAREGKLLGIFAEKQFNVKLLEPIARELQRKVVVIDHLGVDAKNTTEYYENLLKAFHEATQPR